MSKLDIINAEITRRENSNTDLIKGQQEILNAIEQFNKLDEMYRTDEKTARDRLECLYLENRHFSGKWPIVYSSAEVEFYPFYRGEVDESCNPYFPITKIQDGSFDGLEPFPAPITRTGAYQRDRDYSGTIEPTLRGAAITALQAFPDISDETGTSGSCSGETPPGSGVDETTCLANGGTWTPAYGVGDTATEKLRAALDPWRAEVVAVMADLCEDGGTEAAFWQDILDNIDNVLAAIQVDVTYPTQTQDFTPSSAEDIARDYLIAQASTFSSHVSARQSYLTGEASTEEETMFGVVKLRLHQANGSFAKLKASKGQVATNKSIIDDNNNAIKSLNVFKVKNS